MAQTRVTFDVSKGGKVKASGATSMIRHWARDIDAMNGIYRNHSNESIDPERSALNETWFPTDGPRHEWKMPMSIDEIEDRLQDRLATVTGRKRKDAVVMRGIVLGLSPEWIEEHAPNWKTDAYDRKVIMDTLQPVVDLVIKRAGGAKNVVLVAGHFDEEAPQIQIGVTPVTEDGRLRQNDFELFRSPKSIGTLHKKMRQQLKEAGVDVILESSERSKEHLSNLEYARKADKERAEEIEALDKKRQQIADEQAKLDADKAELPELRQRAFNKGRKDGREAGKRDGYFEGRDEGEAEALAIEQQAEREARDLVQQAQASVAKMREERERLEKENKDKRSSNAALDRDIEQKQTTVQQTQDAITAKYNELQELQRELDVTKASRDNMTQLDSDFLDEMLKFPKVQERYEQFKQGRTKGLLAVSDGTKERYERTVGENKRRQQQRFNRLKQQATQQQRQQRGPGQTGYTPMF